MKLSRLYPGSIWFKRFGYLLLIYSIGTNCFFGKIQNMILDEIEHKTNQIESTNKLLKAKQFPDLSILKIEKGSVVETAYNKFRYGVDILGYKIITVDRLNEIADINKMIERESKEITSHIDIIKESLEIILKVITITSNLIWLSIIWALIWLYFDIKKGNAKGFVKKGLIFSIPFNITTFYLLSKYMLEAFISN